MYFAVLEYAKIVERVAGAANLVYSETEGMQQNVSKFLTDLRRVLKGDEGGEQEVPTLEWRGSLSVGHQGLDQDHQQLFRHFNDLASAMRNGSAKSTILHVLDALLDYTVNHFRREEEALALVNYPGLQAQKDEHRMFVEKAMSIREQYRANENNSLIIDTMDFVKRWLVEHIQGSDRAYAPFIKKVKF